MGETAARFLDRAAPFLELDAPALGRRTGPGRDPFLRHVIEARELRRKPFEGGLAVAELGGRVLCRDHDPRRRMREAKRRFGLVHVLSARPARAEGVDEDFALEGLAIERVGRRTLRRQAWHGGIVLQLYSRV